MYFSLAQSQYLVVALLGGALFLVAVAVAWWGFHLTLRRAREEHQVPSGAEYNDGLREGNRPVPLIILLLAAVILVWGILYVVAVAQGGLNVQ